jgi:hypothetical protein
MNSSRASFAAPIQARRLIGMKMLRDKYAPLIRDSYRLPFLTEHKVICG